MNASASGGPVAAPPIHGSSDVISIAVIEENRLVREGLTALLNQLPDLRVVMGVANVDILQLKQADPAVALLDLGLPDGASLRVAEAVGRDLPGCRIIVMDLLPVHEDLMEFIHAGVAGFILKDATLEDLVSTIRAVAGGARVLPPQLTGTLFSQIARVAVEVRGEQALEAVRMTARERQVINLISEGLSNKQIAARLHLSTHTVKSHVRNVMEKLALHTRLQIAAYANRGQPEQAGSPSVTLRSGA